MKQSYIIALTEVLLSGTEPGVALKNTHNLLIKKGHGRLWLAVLRGIVPELQKRNRANTPQLIVSDKIDEKDERLKMALEAIGVNATSAYETSVDTSIIGGFILRYRDRVIDTSYKRVLIDLYRSIIKS